LTNAITLLVNGLFALFAVVMHVIGAVDASIGAAMTRAGLDPQYQLPVMLVVTVLLVVFALRALGGLLGWLIFLLLVLLLLHRIMPAALT
jgi:hypothetical protein